MSKLITILLLVGCSPASRPYHRAYQKVILASVVAMAACDLSQTLNVSNGGRWDGIMAEHDPLLGQTPGATRLVGTAIVALAALGAFTYIPHEYLPEEIKSTVLSYIAIGEGAMVYYNAKEVDRGLTWCGRGPSLGRLPQQPPPL